MKVYTNDLNPQAEAFMPFVRDYLEEVGRLDCRIEAFIRPLYNGREKGYTVALESLKSNDAFIIFFAEHRNSDDLFLWSWRVSKNNFKQLPSISCAEAEASYDKRMTFPFLRFDLAFNAFQVTVETWLKSVGGLDE